MVVANNKSRAARAHSLVSDANNETLHVQIHDFYKASKLKITEQGICLPNAPKHNTNALN